MELENKVAIATGGDSGIGHAICFALAQDGATAFFVDGGLMEGSVGL